MVLDALVSGHGGSFGFQTSSFEPDACRDEMASGAHGSPYAHNSCLQACVSGMTNIHVAETKIFPVLLS